MMATLWRQGDRVTVDFIPEERDCNCGRHDTYGHVDARFGRPAQITFGPERFGEYKGRLGIVRADLAGWAAWVFLVNSGLAESIDLGPSTMGQSLILLTEEAVA